MPAAAIAQAGIGGLQAIGGYIQQRNATKDLEKLVQGYKPNAGILDFYSKALNKYSVSPYQSNSYKYATGQASRGLTQGINSLQDRRSALGGIGTLVQGYNDANLKAAANAEQEQAQALGQLGQAAGMKAQEERYPFELKANMLAAKAAGGNQIMNSGIGNAYGGLNSLSEYNTLQKMYQTDSTNSGGGIQRTRIPVSRQSTISRR
jgi:hypothetical protein